MPTRYIHFTDAQKMAAKEADLPSLPLSPLKT